jgi:glycosyltransferase involved in cell wall biosynthesis/polysaccharide pyruvyl transferase WcaK-like protein
MKFGLVFGNAASNLGDLAINTGAVSLLRGIEAGCEIIVVFLAAKDIYVDAAVASLAHEEAIRHTYLPATGHELTDAESLRLVGQALSDPDRILRETGLEECDAIFYNSGEHLFSTRADENALDLLWRTTIALAAKAAGKKFIMLPSTFGPTDGIRGTKLLGSFAALCDGLAGREPRSCEVLRQVGGSRAAPRWLLDPAFFIPFIRAREHGDASRPTLALVLRLEDYGLRMGKRRSARALAVHKKVAYRGSRAYQLGLAMAMRHVEETQGNVQILIQTLADRDLSEAISADLSAQVPGALVEAVEVTSLPEYLQRLGCVDRLLSSRFHACILAMQCDVPVVGIHASVHGYKMPSLYAGLGLESACFGLEQLPIDTMVKRAEAAFEEGAGFGHVPALLAEKRDETMRWLKDVLQRKSHAPDLLGISRELFEVFQDLTLEYGQQQHDELRSKGESEQQATEVKLQLAADERKRLMDLVAALRLEEAGRRNALQRLRDRHEAELALHEQARATLRQLSDSLAKEAKHLQKQVTGLQQELATRRAALAKAKTEVMQLDERLHVQQRAHDRLCLLLDGKAQEVNGLSHALAVIHGSKRFRLGSALVDSVTSLRGFARLPLALAQAARARPPSMPAGMRTDGAPWFDAASPQTGHVHRAMHDVAAPAPSSALKSTLTAPEKAQLDQLLADAAAQDGRGRVVEFCKDAAAGAQPSLVSYILVRAAHALRSIGDLAGAYELAEMATQAHGSKLSLHALASAAFELCRFEEAMRHAAQLRLLHGPLTGATLKLADEIDGYGRLAQELEHPKASSPTTNPVPHRSVYFLHSSFPHLTGGYASRAHGLIRGIRNAGYDIRPYTRPGFPADISGSSYGVQANGNDQVDEVVYRRIDADVPRSAGEQQYMNACVDAFATVLGNERPAVVHGRSTYLISVPALIAARRAGLPFVYEVSGLWELVHESRETAVKMKARTERMRYFETMAAKAADRVVTLTEAMRDELVARGVPGEKIALAPNSVNPGVYLPRPRDESLLGRLGFPRDVAIVGYVGSFVDYEGLDDLILALEQLRATGCEFRLLLVGDGPEHARIASLVTDSAIADWTRLTGRVAHDEVDAYYSILDICPFPRKPWEVCEIVSPMKPFEPMAMEKAVVVSDTRALCEIIIDGETGLRFEKGKPESLADALRRLIADPALRDRLGKNARRWVIEHRSWDAMGKRIVGEYRAAEQIAGTGLGAI